MIIDTHAHYDDDAFQEDREILLQSLKSNNIEKVVNIGANIETSKNTIDLTNKYDFIYGVIGVHPSDVDELNEENFKFLEEGAKLPKIVAIGEIGLDYYWDNVDRDIQKKWFIRQLQLAKEQNLPVVIHSRDAASDTLEIMKEYGKELVGVIHCYSYSAMMAREYVNMGYYLGIGGVVTFQNAKKLKEVVEAIPLEFLVLETDAPYLSPVPNRGKRNSSLNLKYVIEEISKIKNVSEDEVIRITNENAKKLYHFEG